MNIIQNKSTRALIVIMGALVFFGIITSKIYYRGVNESVDPRIVNARKLYEKYNAYAQHSAYDSVLNLMDAIESIYAANTHYKVSYEVGVLYNNRAAAYLVMALHSENAKNSSAVQDSLMELAKENINSGIKIYTDWLETFDGKNDTEIKNIIESDFYLGLEKYNTEEKGKFVSKRIKEIQTAQTETKRRLSVSYTNLGIVYRHFLKYEDAANAYKRAIELWDRNLTAENNLNKLLGRPLKKRNFIQKMFPPKR